MNEIAKRHLGTHFPPCPGLSRSCDTSRYTPGTGEGGVGAGEPHHGGCAASTGRRTRARPAALATEPITASPRRGVLHGARLLAAASPRGPGLRVGGCHWSGGAGAACPVCASAAGHGGDGAGRVRPAPGKQRENWRGGRVRRVGVAGGVPVFYRSICPCNADDVRQSYKLKFLLKGVRDNSSEFSKFRWAFILSQHRHMMQ